MRMPWVGFKGGNIDEKVFKICSSRKRIEQNGVVAWKAQVTVNVANGNVKGFHVLRYLGALVKDRIKPEV